MGRLVKLELENFKSYKGHQVIGPFYNFSCIIGPNGAGKSNLMDAISFVLGVKSSQLRSSHLKDLIYRGGAINNSIDGLGGNDTENDASGPKKAWVMAEYHTSEGQVLKFMRVITINGASEYRFNGKVTTYEKYNKELEKQNILVKAKNFLVFQGDVEAIASQSPRDLTRLIEQVSGSIELKEEYERLKEEQEKATEDSTYNFNKKRGINAEMKQFKKQKEEAENYKQLTKQLENIKIKYILDETEQKLKETNKIFEISRQKAKTAKERFNQIKEKRYNLFYSAFKHMESKIQSIYEELTRTRTSANGPVLHGTAYLSLEDSEEPYLDGVKYHAMPPAKTFRDMDHLSGGEKTVAALALLFAIHSYQPSPFFVLDEVDAALDNANVMRVASYVKRHASDNFQFVVISLKNTFYERAQALVGIYRDREVNSSKVLTLKLDGEYEN
ncbi:hypothetical protein PIROE2DRAFT_47229 [Piromyces sp. E2]|nr:hypothetical protein PIROE2DRAFT_47229 [Piromyces sp. E2]|eukprot:OUM59274.1 hypothetical protein PIROE2DRAFT_47229 [Piromyces sp. E2]